MISLRSLYQSTEKSNGPCAEGQESRRTLLRNAQREEQEQEQKDPRLSHSRPKGQKTKALDWSRKIQ